MYLAHKRRSKKLHIPLIGRLPSRLSDEELCCQVGKLKSGDGTAVNTIILHLTPLCLDVGSAYAAYFPHLRDEIGAETLYKITQVVNLIFKNPTKLRDDNITAYTVFQIHKHLCTFVAENNTIRVPRKMKKKLQRHPLSDVVIIAPPATEYPYELLDCVDTLSVSNEMRQTIHLKLQRFTDVEITKILQTHRVKLGHYKEAFRRAYRQAEKASS